jgi:hypothetical protein
MAEFVAAGGAAVEKCAMGLAVVVNHWLDREIPVVF